MMKAKCVVLLCALFHVAVFAGAINCHVLIVGGGPGGIHTAYQLSKLNQSNPNSNVCVIEKEDHLGGRIYDVALDPQRPDLVYGTGALRVMENQSYLFALAKELGITLEFAPYRDDLISVRGFFSFSSEDARKQAYPLVTQTENDLYAQLLNPQNRLRAILYPDFRSYAKDVIGSQGYDFLSGVSRFKADFEYPIDARGYLDYIDEENTTCCKPSYPVGGMSSFIKRMSQIAIRNGVKIFVSEPATHISKTGSVYRVTTPHYEFYGDRLVIAVDANSFKYIGGSVANAIKNQTQLKDLIGVKVVTVAQKWPSSWWLNSSYPGKDVRRAWTTEHCLSFIEFPVNPYAVNQNVTRSVYNDEVLCTQFWENTYMKGGLRAVESEISRGLKYLFPKAEIPQPLNTFVKIWPAAWYYLRGGARFTNADIAQWALHPLEGEDISLVGESYYLQRSGWSLAAYLSSMNTLNTNFGFHFRI